MHRSSSSILPSGDGPFLFSSAVTPADVAAAIAAVEILDSNDELVQKLWENARYFKTHMQQLRI